MLPGSPVRISSPGRNMGNKLWQFNLCVDDKSEQMIDFKHPMWGRANSFLKSISADQVCTVVRRLTRMHVLWVVWKLPENALRTPQKMDLLPLVIDDNIAESKLLRHTIYSLCVVLDRAS